MAFEWMAWAVKQKVGKPVSKAVLIALCNYADENGLCYPSINKIKEITENGERAIRNALEHLEAEGFIKRGDRRRRKDGTLSVYEYQMLSSGTRCHRQEMPVAGDAASPVARGAAHNQSLSKPITLKNNPTDYKKPPSKNESEKKKPKRATRIPEDWFVSVELGEWAMANGLARLEVVPTQEQFVDHWQAASGKGSTALDWDAKFRTWVRNEIKWRK